LKAGNWPNNEQRAPPILLVKQQEAAQSQDRASELRGQQVLNATIVQLNKSSADRIEFRKSHLMAAEKREIAIPNGNEGDEHPQNVERSIHKGKKARLAQASNIGSHSESFRQ
jgi:hypothetical protein